MSEAIIKRLLQEADIHWEDMIIVHNPNFWDKVLYYGSLGLGDSYIDGDWEPKENKTIDEVIYIICKADLNNKIKKVSPSLIFILALIWIKIWFLDFLSHLFPKVGIFRSKKVAQVHYDLGNDFYEKMLDKTMNYSCAYFKEEEDTLEEAQIRKMDLIRRKLKLERGDRVLDIGCGWGGLANYLSEFDIIVDGITISKEQLNLAKERYPHLTLNLVDWRLWNPDYKYDAIVSVGMFEHVNPSYYKNFMEKVNNLLKPGGLFLLHTIGGNKERKVGDPWINKHIFPNSCLPTLAQIAKSTEDLFGITDVHNFGTFYDKTLLWWFKNYNKEKSNDLRFHRMWSYYLLSCAGLFRAGGAQLYQVVLMKPPMTHYLRVQ